MRRVLLVDDDEDFRLIIRDLIDDVDSLGELQISEAESSEEAARLCEQQLFDLYIVDYLMNVERGDSSIGFLTKLYGMQEQPSMILCTGFPYEGLDPAYQELVSTGTMRLLPKENLSRPVIQRMLQQLLGSSLSVLVVDDDKEDADFLMHTLEGIPGQHFSIEVAHSLEEGFKALRARDFDVHLIDYRLAGDVATPLLDAIIARTDRPPIVVSQYSAEELCIGMVDRVIRGEVVYVPKAAVDTRRLVSAVQRVSYQAVAARARNG